MNARDELAHLLFITDNRNASDVEAEWRAAGGKQLIYIYAMVDAILAAGYQKPEVRVKWGAAHAEGGVVYNAYRTWDEAQAFVDSMAEVGHEMVVKRCEHTLATHTAWETYEPEDD